MGGGLTDTCETSVRTRSVLIVEDEPDMRNLLRILIDADPSLHVAGECATAEDAIVAAGALAPDLVVLDHQLAGDLTGLAAAPAIAEAGGSTIVMFSAHPIDADAAGEPAVAAYVRKNKPMLLVPTLRQVLGLDS